MTKKASTSAPAPKKKKSTVTTGDIRAGGDVVLGNKTTVGGDYAGRDMVKSTGLQAAEVAQLFDSIYRRIGELPAAVDKAEVREAVDAIQAETTKAVEGKEPPNETIIKLSAQNLIKMAPDILEVLAAGLVSPAAAVAAVIRKVIEKAKAS